MDKNNCNLEIKIIIKKSNKIKNYLGKSKKSIPVSAINLINMSSPVIIKINLRIIKIDSLIFPANFTSNSNSSRKAIGYYIWWTNIYYSRNSVAIFSTSTRSKYINSFCYIRIKSWYLVTRCYFLSDAGWMLSLLSNEKIKEYGNWHQHRLWPSERLYP